MPPHTHMRRSEVYLYFNIPAGDRVIHLMGPAHETRNLVVANKQVAVSPGGPSTPAWAPQATPSAGVWVVKTRTTMTWINSLLADLL